MNVNRLSPRLLLTAIPREDTELARNARTALCAADEGVLTLGLLAAAPNPERVRVLDDDGDVLVICKRGGTVERAALAKQLALLTIEAFSIEGVRLRLSGRLRPHTAHGSHQQAHVCSTRTGVIVALRVERVEVGCPRADGLRHHAWRQLPVEEYADADPDMFAAKLNHLTQHVNRQHLMAIRRIAAHRTGRALTDIAAATISALHSSGADLTWIDSTGAHRLTIDFVPKAMTIPKISDALRREFAAAAQAI